MVCVQVVALDGSELWWDPGDVGKRDDLQLLLNRQAGSNLGTLPTTPRVALMRESSLIPVPVILDSRQLGFAARIENASGSKLKRLHNNRSSGAPICRAVRKEHDHSRTTNGMNWPALAEEPVVRTTIVDYTTAANSAVQRWEGENNTKIGGGVWMWWTDGSRSDDGRVGATAVCIPGDE